jgi:DNA-binding SARP family transcriptional activator
LNELSSRNLFVDALYDAGKGWSYRYHQLYREFLQNLWLERFTGRERRQFLHRAAIVFARKNHLQPAVHLFLQAEEFLRAAAVLRVLGREMIQTGRYRDLEQWLDHFPERIIQAKPWLLFFRAFCRRYSHAAENIPILQKALAMFRTSQDTRGQLLTLGHLMEAVMLMGRDLVPVHDLLDEGEKLLAGLESSTCLREQALLWLQMGFCYALRGDNTRDGYRASQNACLLAKKLQDHPLQIQALIFSIIPLTYLGEFQEGDRISTRVQTMLRKGRYPELEALFLKMWSELAIFAGRLDLDLAKKLIEQLNDRIDQFGLVYLQAPAMYSAFAYHMYAGNPEQAEEIGQTLLKMSESMDNDYGKGFSLILLGLLAYWHKQWSKARESIEAGLKIFRLPATRSPLHDHEFSIGAGLIHTHLRNWHQAENLLQRSLEYFTAISSQLPRTEALLSLALLNEKKGNRKDALKYLEQGLALAASRHFSHFVVISPNDQLKLCILALEAGSKAAQDSATQLLQTGLPETAAREEQWLTSHSHPRVLKTVEDVMRLRHRSHRPRVWIQTLNGFQVWLDESPLSNQAWEGNQAQNLLKAIVALGSGRKVRKELLIDELWPDSSPKAGEKTFKVALHRLRKSLEPDLSSRFGSSYVHLKKGLVRLDDHLCKTDIVQFHALCRKAEARLEERRTQEALKTYAEAISLYKDDFLARDVDAQWAVPIRESLKQRYIEVLLRVARSYETLGSWTKAVRHYEMALECDPVLEEAYRRIMNLYADRGKRSKALQVFEKCRENLRKHADIEPDEFTVSVYRRILG